MCPTETNSCYENACCQYVCSVCSSSSNAEEPSEGQKLRIMSTSNPIRSASRQVESLAWCWWIHNFLLQESLPWMSCYHPLWTLFSSSFAKNRFQKVQQSFCKKLVAQCPIIFLSFNNDRSYYFDHKSSNSSVFTHRSMNDEVQNYFKNTRFNSFRRLHHDT